MSRLWTIGRTRTGKAVLMFNHAPTVTLDRASDRAALDKAGRTSAGPALDTSNARAAFAERIADALEAQEQERVEVPRPMAAGLVIIGAALVMGFISGALIF